jgi:hypothetical protein
MLRKLSFDDLCVNKVEICLVDSASTDATLQVMNRFSDGCDLAVKIANANKPGLGRARNLGIEISTGEIIVFTDDDCYVDGSYFSILTSLWDPASWQYAGGQILLCNADDDPRVANLRVSKIHDFFPNAGADARPDPGRKYGIR